ncbi:Mu transposase domain-containing protein [Actinomadura sp. 3N407]|uniref:Mu transposase domain-containing protein n=1 Tax=Actinomadura sp. 3N407 TaxID=3457423 RepID=UPI003FCD0669
MGAAAASHRPPHPRRGDRGAGRPRPCRAAAGSGPPVSGGRPHLRHVGKDCLVAFEANLYSVPAARVFPRQLVEVRASAATVSLHATVPDEHGITLLAVHPRAVGRGAKVVDPDHWNGLPDGHTRATTTGGPDGDAGRGADDLAPRRRRPEPAGALRFLLARADAAKVEVDRRPLSVYDQITGTGPFT